MARRSSPRSSARVVARPRAPRSRSARNSVWDGFDARVATAWTPWVGRGDVGRACGGVPSPSGGALTRTRGKSAGAFRESRLNDRGGRPRDRFDSRRFTREGFFFGGASDDAPKSRCEVVLTGMCAPRAIEKPVTLRTRSRVGRWVEFIVNEYRIMRTLWTLWPSGLRRQIKENTRRNYGKNNARDASRARARFRTMREQSQRNILVRKGVGSNPTGVMPHC